MRGSILGNEVLRTEDPRLLTGQAQYLDDLRLGDAAQAVFVRSPIAHARITSIDTSEAAKAPGVLGVFTGGDLPGTFRMMPMPNPALERPLLCTETVRFVGDQVAVIVAETKAQATDAAEMVVVDYDPLRALVDPTQATSSDAPVLAAAHGSNVAFNMAAPRDEGLFADADVVVKGHFVNQRLAAAPMEANGCAALPDPDVAGGLILYCSTQHAHGAQGSIAPAIGLDAAKLRVIAPAVGGGFGAKGGAYAEWAVCCLLAQRLQRPVVWFETRSENMIAMVHGRAQVQDIELGAKRDGTLVALRAKVIQDCGGYPAFGAFLPTMTRMMSSGVYKIPKIEFGFDSVLTTTTTVSAYRGAGRPEAAAMIERAMDMLARELDMDPAELRRKNYIAKDAFPYTTASGQTYDVGDYERSLDEALRVSGYEDLRKDQAARRERGDAKLLGIGIGSYVEITGFGGNEFGSVEVHPDGTVTVLTGTSPHGQGHETAWAQIVSATIGVPIESVRVLHSDTKIVPSGGGTMGSRSLQLGGSAVLEASKAVLEKAKQLAAHLLEAAAEDITVFDDGRVGVAGSPQTGKTWAELAQAAESPPDGMDKGLAAAPGFTQAGATFPFGTHVAVVEIDTDTGEVDLLRHVAVDDCGRILNPVLVRGQQHGGIAQGIAQALFEEFSYDAEGNPLTGTFLTYAFPSAAELPSFEASNTETPTHMNPLGAKGIGESGSIGSTPAVQNAVIDALAHLDVEHLDMPLTPERVWRAIQNAR